MIDAITVTIIHGDGDDGEKWSLPYFDVHSWLVDMGFTIAEYDDAESHNGKWLGYRVTTHLTLMSGLSDLVSSSDDDWLNGISTDGDDAKVLRMIARRIAERMPQDPPTSVEVRGWKIKATKLASVCVPPTSKVMFK